MPTLRNLLCTGAVDPLVASMSSEDVRLVINPCEGKYEHGFTVIEIHGQFQLEFRSGELVALNWIVGGSGKSGFQVTGAVFDTTTTIEQFLDSCDEMQIPWSVDQTLRFDRQIGIRTCDLVVVMFDLDQRELERLSVNLR